MSLRGVDLNLLPILQALLREASVTRAAERLGLSQPATSQALGRLRHLLKDPLLVKVGRTMKLTPRAAQLRVLADRSCAAIEGLLSEASPFSPLAAVRSFSVATADYAALIVGQELLPLLRETAPGISVRFVDSGRATRELLLAGSLDLMLVARVTTMLEGLSVSGGFVEEQVCVASIDHPLAERDSISLAELNRHSRLDIDFASDLLLDFGPDHPSEPVRIGPSHLLVLPLLAVASGGIAVVTRALGELAQRFTPLKLIEIVDPHEPIEICLAWSPVNDSDAAHRWLREQLIRILTAHFRRLPVAAGAA